jgi:glutathione S-transferase
MNAPLTLISHHLCPYVQRIAIALAEKGVPFERVSVDLGNKPDWFKVLSPLGKTPVLKVGESPIFESAVILEYLEDTQPNPLHPEDPLRRAEHRGLIEFGSAILNDIWGLYSAADAGGFDARRRQLAERFAWLERRLVAAPWFDGERFSLVDAVFAPIFRYFDVFDQIGDFEILTNRMRIAGWRQALRRRASVKAAVTTDYEDRLRAFLLARNAYLSTLMIEKGMAA